VAKREFLMLAHTYDPKKHGIAGWWVSEKLDGMRCFWDGGVSRGVPKSEVPWANTTKDYRYTETQIATGLWSRYGNVIHAPDWWLDELPDMPLDGELYQKGHRQELMSTLKKIVPDNDAWSRVRYYVFGAPGLDMVFGDGLIENTNFTKTISWVACQMLTSKDLPGAGHPIPIIPPMQMRRAYIRIGHTLKAISSQVAVVHKQIELPFSTPDAVKMIERLLTEVTDASGEGLVLRNPNSYWTPTRSYSLLKIKKLDDAEGIVIGCTAGRETDKGSKLLGLMGALILRLDNGRELELSGFTDAERQLVIDSGRRISAYTFAMNRPGERMPEFVYPLHFKPGTRITFRYRGLTKDGIPQEARYWRRHDETP